MPQAGELTYYEVIGEAGRQHAMDKPFSDDNCAWMLMEIGSVMSLLPRPPARILECGCGTGWLSRMLCRNGYEVVGTDVSEQAIELARRGGAASNGSMPVYHVADSEALAFREEFDVVLFFDSLHHSVNEGAAITSAYRALKAGGMFVASEPGRGHHKVSQEVVARFNVTEKDMPPGHVFRLGKAAGFRRFRAYPRADHMGKLVYDNGSWKGHGWKAAVLSWRVTRLPVLLATAVFLKRWWGVSVMWK